MDTRYFRPSAVTIVLVSAAMGTTVDSAGGQLFETRVISGEPLMVAQASVSSVLPRREGVRVQRTGDRRWLLVEQEPEAMWSLLKMFWRDQGITLEREEPVLGIMVTDWAPSAIYATDLAEGEPTRERYRVRIERGLESGTTEVYLTHRAMTRAGTGWQASSGDLELEAEMLNRLRVFLGQPGIAHRPTLPVRPAEEIPAGEKTLQAVLPDAGPRTRLGRGADGTLVLQLSTDLPPAWEATGRAIERAGFVKNRVDRPQALYYVRFDAIEAAAMDDGTRLYFGFGNIHRRPHEDVFVLSLAVGQDLTEIRVLDVDMEPAREAQARRVLKRLKAQFD